MRYKDVHAAHIAASNFDQGALSHLDYWAEVFGTSETETITAEQVEVAMEALAQRGRLNN